MDKSVKALVCVLAVSDLVLTNTIVIQCQYKPYGIV